MWEWYWLLKKIYTMNERMLQKKPRKIKRKPRIIDNKKNTTKWTWKIFPCLKKKQPSLSTWASKKTHTDDLVQYFFVSLLILYKLKKVKESSHLSLENESKNHTEQKFGRV